VGECVALCEDEMRVGGIGIRRDATTTTTTTTATANNFVVASLPPSSHISQLISALGTHSLTHFFQGLLDSTIVQHVALPRGSSMQLRVGCW
jgi:small-conductance mechanosensitive channel